MFCVVLFAGYYILLLFVAVSEKLSENIHIVANEPSVAFFRIQEHVRKSLPPLVDKKVIVLFFSGLFVVVVWAQHLV